MMKNTTMKMSVNPQESMDKFLQRLEKSVIDFLATGNKTKVGFESKPCDFLLDGMKINIGENGYGKTSPTDGLFPV